MLQKINSLLKLLGIDFSKMYFFFLLFPSYIKDYLKLRSQQQETPFVFKFGKPLPMLMDKSADGGNMKGHYFHQDLLVAKKIYSSNPLKHMDIGSRMDGFVAHVAVFREIEVLDIRDAASNTENISFKQADLMSPVDNSLNEYCDSLSCLHALEHFGLGRYGDDIDFSGHLKGLDNLYKILKPKGVLYLSVPIGDQRIEFNAHRVFSVRYILELVDVYSIRSFSYIDDKGDLHTDVNLTDDDIDTNYGCTHGCGILELIK